MHEGSLVKRNEVRLGGDGNTRVTKGSTSREPFLVELGDAVRAARDKRGMTRKILARDSGVSERYLAQLEAGRGNPSIQVLRKIAAAMVMPVEGLLSAGRIRDELRREVAALVDRMPPSALEDLAAELRRRDGAGRRARRIGLIGLRGAGKSTLGHQLAAHFDVPFIELDRVIEQAYGGGLDQLFDLAGQPAYRRYEQRCLEEVMRDHSGAVIATGGGIVANEAAFAALLQSTHSVWLRADPAAHMARVVAQGDLRPMAENREAMQDLRRILAAREAAYGRAADELDTSGRTVEESVADLVVLVGKVMEKPLAAE